MRGEWFRFHEITFHHNLTNRQGSTYMALCTETAVLKDRIKLASKTEIYYIHTEISFQPEITHFPRSKSGSDRNQNFATEVPYKPSVNLHGPSSGSAFFLSDC